jgi:hypothetical protein
MEGNLSGAGCADSEEGGRGDEGGGFIRVCGKRRLTWAGLGGVLLRGPDLHGLCFLLP